MKFFYKSIAVFALFVLPLVADAQCAMCKAVAETDQAGGGTAALGLNEGILYLMIFPYLLLGGVGYAIYRLKKSQKQVG